MQTADSETLVIFDLEQVLFLPDDLVLRPCSEALLKDQISMIQMGSLGDHDFDLILSKIYLQKTNNLVDANIIQILAELQAKHIPAIGLTKTNIGSKGYMQSQEDARLVELEELGISFSETFPDKNGMVLMIDEEKNQPIFKDGVLFCDRYSKEEVLSTFISRLNFKPKNVLFIDGKLKNVKSVEEKMEKQGIAFQGYHYIAVKKDLEIDDELAKYQLKHLLETGKWLNDEEAGSHLSADE